MTVDILWPRSACGSGPLSQLIYLPLRGSRARRHRDALGRQTVPLSPEETPIVQLQLERVDVQEHALEVRIRAEGLASLVAELRQQGERMAA